MRDRPPRVTAKGSRAAHRFRSRLERYVGRGLVDVRRLENGKAACGPRALSGADVKVRLRPVGSLLAAGRRAFARLRGPGGVPRTAIWLCAASQAVRTCAGEMQSRCSPASKSGDSCSDDRRRAEMWLYGALCTGRPFVRTVKLGCRPPAPPGVQFAAPEPQLAARYVLLAGKIPRRRPFLDRADRHTEIQRGSLRIHPAVLARRGLRQERRESRGEAPKRAASGRGGGRRRLGSPA